MKNIRRGDKEKDTATVERHRTSDLFERPTRTGAAESRLADGAVKTTHPTHEESIPTKQEDRKGNAENEVLEVPCRKDRGTCQVYYAGESLLN